MVSLDAMLSSTSKDLGEHRKLAEDACQRAGFSPNTMDYLSAENDSDAIDVSMRLVEESEVYIGIFGMRYGFRPKDPRNPNDISITEMEYRRAKELGMPILIYIMSDNHLPPDTTGMGLIEMRQVQTDFFESDPIGQEKLDLFKKELTNNHIVSFFDSKEDLRVDVLTSLTKPSLKDAANTYYKKQRERLKASEQNETGKTPQSDIPYPPKLYAFPPYSGQGAMFVGRRDELQLLNNWAEPNSKKPMLVLEAIGGMGKSALTWRWVQDRAVEFEGVFWYSFYEGGAEMGAFVRHALAYVTRVSPDSLKGKSVQVMLPQLVNALKSGRYLLVLDGLERVLVAYHRWDAAQMQDDEVEEGKDYRDCTNPRDTDVLKQLANCDPSRVLITSRLMPNALKDGDAPLSTVQLRELKGLSRSDAQMLWQKHGITWDDDGVMDSFVQQFDRHSLLMKLMVDVIKKNRRANGNFQIWFVTYGDSFNAFENMKAKRHHILKFAYQGLSPEQQKLLSQMAALGNAIDIDTLNVFNPYMNMPKVSKMPRKPRFHPKHSEKLREKINREYLKRYRSHSESLMLKMKYEKSNEYYIAIAKFDALLQDLEERGLIWWDSNNNQYDLHPVVRGYSFSQLSKDDKPKTFDFIYNHFESQERNASRGYFTSYADMQNLIAMYNALIGANKYDEAAKLFLNRIADSLIFDELALYHRAYELLLPFFSDGLSNMPRITSEKLQGYILSQMATVLYYLEHHEDAIVIETNHIANKLALKDIVNLKIGLNNYGHSLMNVNQLDKSLRVQNIALELAKELNNDMTIEEKNVIAFSYYSLIEINYILGKWEEGNDAYSKFIEYSIRDSFQITAKLNYIKTLIHLNVDASDIKKQLNDCENDNIELLDKFNQRLIARLRGDIARREKNYDSAIQYYSQAIHIGNEQGIRYTSAWDGLAQIYQIIGNRQEALRIVNDGVDSHGHTAAVVHTKSGNFEEAKEAALEFYRWAWAQGEPYVRRWELDEARKILTELGVDEPQLPVWDESMYEPFAHEAEIRALLERLKAEKADEEDES